MKNLLTNEKEYAIMKVQKGRERKTTQFPKANVNIGGNDMKMKSVKVFLKTAMEINLPFVDKTRTMTGRVSENI